MAVLTEANRIGKSYALNNRVQQIGIADTALESTVQEAVVTENIAEGQTVKEREAMLWHRRFGHLSSQSLQHVAEHTTGLPELVKVIKEACDMCKRTKAVRVINRRAPEWTKTALQRIHSDIWGPFSVATPYGDTYFATFTDDYTRKSWVYLMKNRSQLRSVFIQFRTLVELVRSTAVGEVGTI